MRKMTNKELIKILQKSVIENGELPIEMEINSDEPYNIKEVLYDAKSVTIYNF